jgi:hypothetical protein
MSKVRVGRETLRKFSVRDFKDFEGCAPALKFLTAKYGDSTTYDLADCEQDVKDMIFKYDHPDWVINFLLNLIRPKHRLTFYFDHLLDAIESFEDKELKGFLKTAVAALSDRISKKEIEYVTAELNKHAAAIDAELEIQSNEDIINSLMAEKYVIISFRSIVEDTDKKFTRSITSALMKLAESKVYRDLVQYTYTSNIQEIALSLVEYTELWHKKKK